MLGPPKIAAECGHKDPDHGQEAEYIKRQGIRQVEISSKQIRNKVKLDRYQQSAHKKDEKAGIDKYVHCRDIGPSEHPPLEQTVNEDRFQSRPKRQKEPLRPTCQPSLSGGSRLAQTPQAN